MLEQPLQTQSKDQPNKSKSKSIARKTRVQGLQVFAFCAVNVNNEYRKPRFKRKLKG